MVVEQLVAYRHAEYGRPQCGLVVPDPVRQLHRAAHHGPLPGAGAGAGGLRGGGIRAGVHQLPHALCGIRLRLVGHAQDLRDTRGQGRCQSHRPARLGREGPPQSGGFGRAGCADRCSIQTARSGRAVVCPLRPCGGQRTFPHLALSGDGADGGHLPYQPGDEAWHLGRGLSAGEAA